MSPSYILIERFCGAILQHVVLHIHNKPFIWINMYIWIYYIDMRTCYDINCIDYNEGNWSCRQMWPLTFVGVEFAAVLKIRLTFAQVNFLNWALDSTSDLCRAKIEKEKREHAKQHGMIRTEFSGGEIAEEMEKERRLFQLQMCEVSLRQVNSGRSSRKSTSAWVWTELVTWPSLSAVSPQSQRDQNQERRRLPAEPHQVFPRSVQVGPKPVSRERPELLRDFITLKTEIL